MYAIARRGFSSLLLVLIALGWALPLGAKQAAGPADASATREVVLSGEGWKLGSFPMGAGEERGVYNPSFDESAFRPVAVPAEIQLTLGLEGMDLYRQSKKLSLINKKEWWYRKHFTVPEDQSRQTASAGF